MKIDDALDDDHQALLDQWNAAVLASGSRTHGGAVGVIANMRRLLIDIHKADQTTGAITLTDELRNRVEDILQMTAPC